MILNQRPGLFLLVAVAALASACTEEPQIQAYSAPKEQQPPSTHPTIHPAIAQAQTDGAGDNRTGVQSSGLLKWDLPDGWTIEPGEGMRLATIKMVDPADEKVPVVEIAISRFPGDVGGLLANMNRWRAQIGLAPLETEEQAKKDLELLKDAAMPMQFVDLRGKEVEDYGQTSTPRIVMATMFYAGHTWYFKVLDDAAKVEPHIAGMRSFAKTIRPVEDQPAQKAGEKHNANDDPAAVRGPDRPRQTPADGGMERPAAPENAERLPTVQIGPLTVGVPSGWKLSDEPKPMRVATFIIGPAEDNRELAITQFPAQAMGDALANVNRWRQQVGAPPVAKAEDHAEVKELEIDKLPGLIYAFSSPDGVQPQQQMLVAAVERDDVIWYFRLNSPTGKLPRERAIQYVQFLENIRFAND